MKKDEAIKKRKIWAILIWTFLYLLFSIWGNGYLEPAGLAVDRQGNLYLSLIDTYRDEARIRKFNPNGRMIWSRTFQGNHLSVSGNESIMINPADDIFQIVSKLGKNSAYLTVLCYNPGGRLRWVKELSGIPYFKEHALDGNDLLIIGLDNNNASFKIIRISPNGSLTEPVYLYNPFEQGVARFTFRKNALFLANNKKFHGKLAQMDLQGAITNLMDLPPRQLLGVDWDANIYLSSWPGEAGLVEKYTPDGRINWSATLSRPGSTPVKRIIEPRLVELDPHANLYITGKDQMFTAERNFIKAFYNKGVRYHYRPGTYYRTRGGDRIFLTKISPAGHLIWNRRIVTNQSDPTPYGLAVASDASVYIAGNYSFLDAKNNLMIAKYSPNGKLLWVKRNLPLPVSFFYIGLCYTLLLISWLKRSRFWKMELLALIVLIAVFWGLEIF